MHAKPYIVGCLLLLTLSVVWSDFSIAAPASAGIGSMPQWKTIPEDSTTWRREPFKSPEGPKRGSAPSAKQGLIAGSADIALQGIMKSNKHYYAIINGKTVKPGDHIEGWSVAEISRYRVTLRREKEKQIYDIYQGTIDRGTR